MTDQSSQFLKFYVTAASPCPYIDGQVERKIFTELSQPRIAYDLDAILHRTPIDAFAEKLHQSLTLVGFRRSQDIAYRPACENCHQCKSVRVLVKSFVPTRSQKRIINKNKDIYRTIKINVATEEHYHLLKKYLHSRHNEGGMANLTFTDFQAMVESSPINTKIIEYRSKNEILIGAALTDFMPNAASMVYSFYDVSEEMKQHSLGTYMVLDHIRYAAKHELDHIYLGYWVKNSQKMNYKQNFKPLEVLNSDGWEIIK